VRPTEKGLFGKIKGAKVAVSEGKITIVEPLPIIIDAQELGYDIKELSLVLSELLEGYCPGCYAGGVPPHKII